MPLLDRDEYVEQAYFFRTLGERIGLNLATQDLMGTIREELLSSTRLPMAVDFLGGELRHSGTFAPAMARLPHYFTPFQTYVVTEAEREEGRFDFLIALEILEREARYRGESDSRQGLFLFHFEALCRNRLGYDRGLAAVAADPIYDEGWREWILTVRRQVGLVDFADLIYVRSEFYLDHQARRAGHAVEPEKPVLFGLREGKIAFANRRRDPLLLFGALARHLSYPTVPRPKPIDESRQIIPNLMRRVERLETRLKLLEEEQQGGLDLRKLYGKPPVDLESE